MSIKSRDKMPREVTIDLNGPEGNAFVLMGKAKTWAKQMGLDADAIITDMQSDDYEHLLDVFDEHFGDFVTLYR